MCRVGTADERRERPPGFHDSLLPIVSTELCNSHAADYDGTPHPAHWRCETCDGSADEPKFMCDRMKKKHLKNKLTKQHRFRKLIEPLPEKKPRPSCNLHTAAAS